MFNTFFNSIKKIITEEGDEIMNEVFRTSESCKAFLCSEQNYLDDYCSYHQRCLTKFKEKKNISNSDIQRIETFETWFNGNCGYVVINQSSSFSIWLVIYEPAIRNMSENFSLREYKFRSNNIDLSRVLNWAKKFKKILQEDNFDLDLLVSILTFRDDYISFDEMLLNCDIVVKKNIPQKWVERHGPFLAPGYIDVKVPIDNIDEYAKIFDILKVNNADCQHVGIYMGNNYVCHFSKQRNGTYVDKWEDFKKMDGFEGNIDSVEATIYHQIIPFKNYKKITQQIAWAVENNVSTKQLWLI